VEAMDIFEWARDRVVARLDEAVEEGDLELILDEIVAAAADDLGVLQFAEVDRDVAERLFVAAQGWASLASYAVGRFYTEPRYEVGTPFRKIGGWSKGVASRLSQLSSMLAPALQKALKLTGASSFSVGLNFPWGVQVSLTWP
jgi:hypothetical protein